ncbi:MAG: sigma-70 family RNA polymerase sigma factor [Rhodothermia bacterium]|nr:MAG: sigma-70 family RNA polymerase sigma factor [Rhodothermia bacterium]
MGPKSDRFSPDLTQEEVLLSENDVTALLVRARNGDADAFSTLVEQIYGELRVIAASQRRRLGAAATINTTAVVHEAYAKMAGAAQRPERAPFADRGHFFRVASRVMRDIIADYAKAQSTQKRGGRYKPLSIEEVSPAHLAARHVDPEEILTVHMALTELEVLNSEAANVAELRYFAGLTTDETAEALGMSRATVKRRWTVARAWLYQNLSER